MEPGHAGSRSARSPRSPDKSTPPNVNLLRQAAIGSCFGHRLGDARTARRDDHPLRWTVNSALRPLPASVGRARNRSLEIPEVLAAASAALTPQEPGSTASLRHRRGQRHRFQGFGPHEVASLRFDLRVCPALESSTQPGSDFGPFRVQAPAVGLVHAGLGCLVFGSAPARLDIGTRRLTLGPAVRVRRLRAVHHQGVPPSGGIPGGLWHVPARYQGVLPRAPRLKYQGQGLRRLTTAA